MKTKVALITGGSRGLGKETAISLAKQGVGIVLTYLSNQDEAQEAVRETEALGQTAIALQLDVADIKSFDRFLASLHSVLTTNFQTENLDFLINNAGIGKTISIADLTEPDFDTLLHVHFKACEIWNKHVKPTSPFYFDHC